MEMMGLPVCQHPACTPAPPFCATCRELRLLSCALRSRLPSRSAARAYVPLLQESHLHYNPGCKSLVWLLLGSVLSLAQPQAGPQPSEPQPST